MIFPSASKVVERMGKSLIIEGASSESFSSKSFHHVDDALVSLSLLSSLLSVESDGVSDTAEDCSCDAAAIIGADDDA